MMKRNYDILLALLCSFYALTTVALILYYWNDC